jgi:hypothetical protein
MQRLPVPSTLVGCRWQRFCCPKTQSESISQVIEITKAQDHVSGRPESSGQVSRELIRIAAVKRGLLDTFQVLSAGRSGLCGKQSRAEYYEQQPHFTQSNAPLFPPTQYWPTE